MSTTSQVKAILKRARSELDSGNYEIAKEYISDILELDPENYNG